MSHWLALHGKEIDQCLTLSDISIHPLDLDLGLGRLVDEEPAYARVGAELDVKVQGGQVVARRQFG